MTKAGASILFFMMIVVVCIAYVTGVRHGYKYGQIDALSGVVRYELVKLPNGEMRWIEEK